MEGQITLRDATAEDLPFLALVYGDTRRQEVEAWGWPPEQQKQFLQMQFHARRQWYRAAFPNAADHIICHETEAVGYMVVSRDGTEEELIDIALLGEYRNHGIGTSLLRRLLQECEARGRALHLQALKSNPAIRLYQRLGFVQSGADDMYAQFQWRPPAH